jgi:hypothetical protein
MASTSVSGITEAPGMARIKAEYLVKIINKESSLLEEPQVKKLKISTAEEISDNNGTSSSSSIPSHSKKERQRGKSYYLLRNVKIV